MDPVAQPNLNDFSTLLNELERGDLARQLNAELLTAVSALTESGGRRGDRSPRRHPH